MRSRAVVALTALSLLSAGAARAQFPGIGGGTSDLMGQALPNVSSASAGNTAGVLSYCVKNNILKGNTATSVLSSLSGRSGVQSSSAFDTGKKGQLETGNGNLFSLGGLKEKAKTKVCDMVLQHGQSLL